MKINIAQKLNTNMLNEVIEAVLGTPEYNPYSTYLIMNNDTLDALKNDEYVLEKCKRICANTKVSPRYISRYCGINIAVCDALDFGEIEIVRGYRN